MTKATTPRHFQTKNDNLGGCSSTLINTVNQNGKLYLLTANHCVDPNLEELNTTNIYISFKYEVITPSIRIPSNEYEADRVEAKLMMRNKNADIAIYIGSEQNTH